jgi:hypothetical protein
MAWLGAGAALPVVAKAAGTALRRSRQNSVRQRVAIDNA